MTSETSAQELLKRVRKHLSEGGVLGIIGWMDRNHSDYTRKIAEDKLRRVRFIEANVNSISRSIGYILFTEFVDHATVRRWRDQAPAHPHILGSGEVKRILADCRDILFGVPANGTQPKGDTVPSPDKKSSPTPTPLELSDGQKVDEGDVKLASMFYAYAPPGSNKPVSGRLVTELVKEAYGEDAPSMNTMVRRKLLEGVVQDGGKKVSHYKEGKELSKFQHLLPEPTDPIEKARRLIAREQEFLDRESKLETELEQVHEVLRKIKQAKELFASFDKALL